MHLNKYIKQQQQRFLFQAFHNVIEKIYAPCSTTLYSNRSDKYSKLKVEKAT